VTRVLAVVVLTLFWDPVTRDCKGGLEPIPVAYEVLVFDARVIGQMTDGFGNLVPVYRKTDLRPLTVATSLEVTEPAAPDVGEVTYIGDPVAIDGTFNRSDEPCTP
jgi:hypothetical protein